VVTAIDCGVAVSPDQIAAQMEGGTCYGLSAALFGEITLTDGAVDQSNFDTYRVLRINEAPTVETYIVAVGQSAQRRGRAGHAGDRPGGGQRPAFGPSKATTRLPVR
jgi:isoquinoline 1-oxidoreductase beta subunit